MPLSFHIIHSIAFILKSLKRIIKRTMQKIDIAMVRRRDNDCVIEHRFIAIEPPHQSSCHRTIAIALSYHCASSYHRVVIPPSRHRSIDPNTMVRECTAWPYPDSIQISKMYACKHLPQFAGFELR